MLKNFFILSTLFCLQLFGASSIPQYEVDSVGSGIVTLTNGAQFQGVSQNSLTINGWKAGDLIVLMPAQNDFPATCYFNGSQNICPRVNLKNLTRGVTCLTNCIRAADPGSDGSFNIVSINTTQRLITLDDSSEWIYETSGNNYITLWKVGNQVLIGQNPSIGQYDAFFFNTSAYNTLLVKEN